MPKHNNLAILLAGIILLSCRQPASPKELAVMFWGGPDEVALLNTLKGQFEQSHTGYTWHLEHAPSDYFSKLHLRFAAKQPPDIFLLNNLYLKTYQAAGVLKPISLQHKSDFVEAGLKAGSVDKQLYIVPRDLSMLVLFYNQTQLKTNTHFNAYLHSPTVSHFKQTLKSYKRAVYHQDMRALFLLPWINDHQAQLTSKGESLLLTIGQISHGR
jgi:maltose-binding protein MalE